MEKREQRVVVLFLHAEIVEPALARREPVGLDARARERQGAEQLLAAPTEHLGMTLLVERVPQIQTAEERVGRELGCPREIATAIGLRLGEREELLRATVRV